MDAPDPLVSAAAGMRWQNSRLAVIAENLANAGTAGFHRRAEPAAAFAHDLNASLTPEPAEGALRRTDVPTDLALVGPGYFCIVTPEGVRYSRDGRLTRDPHGYLTDLRGNRLLGSLGAARLPAHGRIAPDGSIRSGDAVIDRLRIVELPRVQEAEPGYLSAPSGSVPRRAHARVEQGYLEDSSVDPIAEMTALVETERLFEANQKSVQRVDETLKRAAAEVGRARA